MSTPVTSGSLVTTMQSIAQALNGGQSGNSMSMAKGVVQSVNLTASPRTINVYLNGDTNTLVENLLMEDSYTPVVGDVALIAVQNGGQMIAMGQASQSGTASQNGWVSVTLENGTGSPATSMGIWQARLQVVSGDIKVEMRGSATPNGTNTKIGMMPAGMAPKTDRKFLAGRDENGAIHVLVSVFTDGSVYITGADTSMYPTTSSPSSGSTANGGNNSNSATDSFSVSVSGSTSGESVSVTDSGSTGGASAGTAHTHSYSGSGSGSGSGGTFSGSGSGNTNGHSHTINQHTHTISHTHTSTPTFPNQIYFDNTSFYQ